MLIIINVSIIIMTRVMVSEHTCIREESLVQGWYTLVYFSAWNCIVFIRHLSLRFKVQRQRQRDKTAACTFLNIVSLHFIKILRQDHEGSVDILKSFIFCKENWHNNSNEPGKWKKLSGISVQIKFICPHSLSLRIDASVY